MWNFNNYKDNTAILTRHNQIITYEDISRFCGDMSLHIEAGKLMFILCGNYDKYNDNGTSDIAASILGYVSAIQLSVPVMLMRNSVSDCVSLADSYHPAYIWQSESQTAPCGYHEEWTAYGYVLYAADEFFKYAVNPRLALLLSTSGSTGSSKQVRITYDNIRSNTEAIIEALGITSSDRAMIMLPINYTYGLSIVNTYLYAGATLLIPESSIISGEFWSFLASSECSAICGVPYTYETIRKLGYLEGIKTKLKLATQAGGKLSRDTEEYMLLYAFSKEMDFAVMYGQTEATARMSCHKLNEHLNKFGSAGKAIPGGELSICNGEIVYRGSNVTMGYAVDYRNLAEGDNNSGVLYTGDTGYIDADGYLYVTGRKGNFAKINGYRIALDELSHQVRDMSGCNTVCMEIGQKLYAVCEVKEKEAESIMKLLHKITNLNRALCRVKCVDSIPLNDRGKVDIIKIKRMIADST